MCFEAVSFKAYATAAVTSSGLDCHVPGSLVRIARVQSTRGRTKPDYGDLVAAVELDGRNRHGSRRQVGDLRLAESKYSGRPAKAASELAARISNAGARPESRSTRCFPLRGFGSGSMVNFERLNLEPRAIAVTFSKCSNFWSGDRKFP